MYRLLLEKNEVGFLGQMTEIIGTDKKMDSVALE